MDHLSALPFDLKRDLLKALELAVSTLPSRGTQITPPDQYAASEERLRLDVRRAMLPLARTCTEWRELCRPYTEAVLRLTPALIARLDELPPSWPANVLLIRWSNPRLLQCISQAEITSYLPSEQMLAVQRLFAEARKCKAVLSDVFGGMDLAQLHGFICGLPQGGAAQITSLEVFFVPPTAAAARSLLLSCSQRLQRLKLRMPYRSDSAEEDRAQPGFGKEYEAIFQTVSGLAKLEHLSILIGSDYGTSVLPFHFDLAAFRHPHLTAPVKSLVIVSDSVPFPLAARLAALFSDTLERCSITADGFRLGDHGFRGTSYHWPRVTFRALRELRLCFSNSTCVSDDGPEWRAILRTWPMQDLLHAPSGSRLLMAHPLEMKQSSLLVLQDRGVVFRSIEVWVEMEVLDPSWTAAMSDVSEQVSEQYQVKVYTMSPFNGSILD